jgi:hypothetical protein
VAERHRFGPVEVEVPLDLARADLELYGVDHFCPSYAAMVFLNDADVDVDTASEERASYAGRFAIFGHQRCSGDEGHCEVHEHLRRFDDRPSHPLTRAFKRVVITDALRRLPPGADVTVTIVVSADPGEAPEREGSLLVLDGLQITTFV